MKSPVFVFAANDNLLQCVDLSLPNGMNARHVDDPCTAEEELVPSIGLNDQTDVGCTNGVIDIANSKEQYSPLAAFVLLDELRNFLHHFSRIPVIDHGLGEFSTAQ